MNSEATAACYVCSVVRLGPTILDRMAKRIAELVGWTLIVLAVVLLAVPVWLTEYGHVCDGPGVLGAFQASSLSNPCRTFAVVRLYHVAPFLVIGISCLIGARTIFKSDDDATK